MRTGISPLPSADAVRYSKIGRAGLDASGVNPSLVSGVYFGQGVASDGQYVYWGESGSFPKLAQVGRATVDGGEPNHAFQQGATYCGIFDLVSTATEIFWLKSDCSGLEFGWDIDRTVKTGGQGGYAEVGSGNSTVCGFDVDAGHVYWTTLQGAPTYRGANIGRASIDGNPASVNNAFITGASFTSQAGLDVAGNFIYWTNTPGVGELIGSIGRANVDGTGVAHFFISQLFNPGSLDVDAAGPQPAPPGSQGQGPPPSRPPHMLNVGVSNAVFTPGSGSTGVRFRGLARAANSSAAASKAVPHGTVFSFKLDRAATVTIQMQKVKAGRLQGGKCKKPTKALAKIPSATFRSSNPSRATPKQASPKSPSPAESKASP